MRKAKKVRLEILYDDMSTKVHYFESRKEAQWYAMNEGDHVWQYKIKEVEIE